MLKLNLEIERDDKNDIYNFEDLEKYQDLIEAQDLPIRILEVEENYKPDEDLYVEAVLQDEDNDKLTAINLYDEPIKIYYNKKTGFYSRLSASEGTFSFYYYKEKYYVIKEATYIIRNKVATDKVIIIEVKI